MYSTNINMKIVNFWCFPVAYGNCRGVYFGFWCCMRDISFIFVNLLILICLSDEHLYSPKWSFLVPDPHNIRKFSIFPF